MLSDEEGRVVNRVRGHRHRVVIEYLQLGEARASQPRARARRVREGEANALVTLDEAVKISGLSSRVIYRLIEEGRIHFAETAAGVGLICPATLLNRSPSPTKHRST